MPPGTGQFVPTIVFLGGGRITSAIMAGLRVAGSRQPVVVHDRNLSKLKRLHRQYDVVVEPNLEQAVRQADFLIVAVRPDSVPALLERLCGTLATRSQEKNVAPLIAISLAAGIPLARLRQMLNSQVLWARAMPSPVCKNGTGLTALAWESELPRQQRHQVRSFFSQIGSVLDLPEIKFDAFTVTYSSSHGYHALATLADAAEQLGLDRKTAYMAASHALADGIVAWRSQKDSLGILLEEAATPGGIAETAMAAMNRGGYAKAVQTGLRAGLAAARANATPRGSSRRSPVTPKKKTGKRLRGAP